MDLREIVTRGTLAAALVSGLCLSAPAAAHAQEEAAEEDDHFRAFYTEASAGYSWLNLGIVSEDNLAPDAQRVSGSGFNIGAGAGLYVSILTLGLQVEMAAHDGFDLGVLALDIGLRGTGDLIEPYFRVGAGYAWMFNMDVFERDLGVEDQIQGFALDLGFGFDFPINHLVAIGIGIDIAIFQLNRSRSIGIPQGAREAVDELNMQAAAGDPNAVADFDPEVEGNAIGIQLTALPSVSLHF